VSLLKQGDRFEHSLFLPPNPIHNHKMKIVIIIQRWFGGHGTVAKSLKKRLAEKGHEVVIISREDDLDSMSLVNGYKKLRKRMEKETYDILYTFDWSIGLTFIDFKNHFCCFHGHTPQNIGKMLQSYVGNRLKENLIVVGDTLKERFPKSNLIYNGVDLDLFKPLGYERKYFGWVNKSSEIKNKEEIEKIAKEYQLPLLIAYNTPYEDMNEFYNHLKVFVSYPPEYAGFNMCWIEAMASGVPIVLGNEHGVNIPLNNKYPKDLRKYVVEKDLTWKSNVEKLLELFEKCLKKD
jgi:hypothetical protein